VPRQRIPLRTQQSHPDLVSALATELRAGDAGTPNGPQIIEEDLPQNRRYVTVIWPNWEGIPAEDRGRIIGEAYEQAEGSQSRLTIGAALGLTPDEAVRIGANARG